MTKSILGGVARIRWIRVVLTGIAAYLTDLLIITLVVTAHAFKLGFEARGAPDQTKVGEFAQRFGSSWGPMLGFFLTFGAAVWVARKVRTSTALHGVLVGTVVAVIGLILGHTLALRTLLYFAATIAAGWVGGLVGGRTITTPAEEPSSKTDRG